MDMTEKEIKQTLSDRNNLKVTTVKRLGQTQTIKFNVIGKKPSNTVNIEKKGQTDKLHTLRVFDYIPSNSCYRCGESDHKAKQCKSNKEVCPICCEDHSMKEHKERQLTKTYCKKCNSYSHPLLKCKRKHNVESVESISPNQEVNMETIIENQDNERENINDNNKEVQADNINTKTEEKPSLGSLQKQINMILDILRKSEPKSNK